MVLFRTLLALLLCGVVLGASSQAVDDVFNHVYLRYLHDFTTEPLKVLLIGAEDPKEMWSHPGLNQSRWQTMLPHDDAIVSRNSIHGCNSLKNSFDLKDWDIAVVHHAPHGYTQSAAVESLLGHAARGPAALRDCRVLPGGLIFMLGLDDDSTSTLLELPGSMNRG